MNFIGVVNVILSVAIIVLLVKRVDEFRWHSRASYECPAFLSANWFMYTYVISGGYAIVLLGAGCLMLMATEPNALIIYQGVANLPFQLLIFALFTTVLIEVDTKYPNWADKWEMPLNNWAKEKLFLGRSLLLFMGEVLPLVVVAVLVSNLLVRWIYG